MPTYVSKLGKWTPAIEKNVVAIDKNGKKFIYDGPDREALKELEIAGQDHFGIDFRRDPDLLQRLRTKGYSSIDEYLKEIGFEEQVEVKKVEEKAEQTPSHTEPKKKKLRHNFSGGQDFANQKNSVYGAFDEAPKV